MVQASLKSSVVLRGLAVAAMLVGLAQPAFAASETKTIPYGLDYCIVSGEKLSDVEQPVTKVYGNREVTFCCNNCPKKFEADQAGYFAKIDAALVSQQMPIYPQNVCVVDGKKLGETGKPIDLVYENRLVRLCSQGCEQAFEKETKKFLDKLDQAVITAQSATYPLTTCVVSGEKLGGMGKPLDLVYNGRLVRFCCGGCVGTFKKDPAKYLAKIDAAKSESKSDVPGSDMGHQH